MPDFSKLSLVFSLFCSTAALALPIGFGRNQGDLEYDELKTDNFYVYHDRRSPHEARVVLEALEAARPRLQLWLGIERKKALPVILSSTTSNASFANFITDAIELQTLSRGGRDLAWHEYTHSTMYRHLDNLLGPAGSILHLPWMPAWWIEGLAEAMSVSGGSDIQYGIERYYALGSASWPTYDRLHSLYDGDSFSGVGYAISGAFVSYLLRTYDPQKLPQVLESFYKYSMPWWWPWTFVPFNNFMPMDEALKEWTGHGGQELYELYKRDAKTYWSQRKDLHHEKPFRSRKAPAKAIEEPKGDEPTTPLPSAPGQSHAYIPYYQIQSRGNALYHVDREGSEVFEAKTLFKEGRGTDSERGWELPEGAMSARIVRSDFKVYLTGENAGDFEPVRQFWIESKGKQKQLFERKAYVNDLFLSKSRLVWTEEFLENQRICFVPRTLVEKARPIAAKAVSCGPNLVFPKSFRVLGSRRVPEGENEIHSEIWMSTAEETLVGDRHAILSYNPDNGAFTKISNSQGGKPLSVAFNKNAIWLAAADQTYHFLRVVDAKGNCLSEKPLRNMIDKLYSSSDGNLLITLWEAQSLLFLQLSNYQVGNTPCQMHGQPNSPLAIAMRGDTSSLKEIMVKSDPWTRPDPTVLNAEAKRLAEEPVMGSSQALPEGLASEPAQWRPRPVFGFPWIGIDAVGYQYGMISVPLMDHLQNETVQLTALYGVDSRYPNLELGITTTRFDATWSFDVFRRQTWNRSYGDSTYYFDERGAEIGAVDYINSLDMTLRFSYKHSWLIPYLGEDWLWDQLAKGYIRETSVGLSKSHSFWWSRLSYYLNSNLATKVDNNNFDYEQTGGGTTLSIPITLFNRSTYQNWGLSYSRVRGTRRKFLMEAYRPLRTYVPGSGGGLNEINQPLLGPGALTNAAYGDTQARFNLSWTFPVLPDLAKLVHIVYLKRLDFTSFYNYGDAWFHYNPPRFNDAIRAHGYNLDLLADVKGVKLNAGIGVGQVWGNDWEMYALFGFDALINQGNQ